eukprot:s108_g14.t1
MALTLVSLQLSQVRVLKHLAYAEVDGLTKVFDENYFAKEEDAAQACRSACYSDLGCQWWYYNQVKGCFVEDISQEAENQRPQVSTFPRRVALALGVVGLVGLGLAANRGDCMEYGTYYANPHSMVGTGRSNERSASACQDRCKNIPGCAHFSFWPDGGCMVTGPESRARAAPRRFSATVSGPASCGGGAEEPPSASIPEPASDSSSGLTAVPTMAPIELPDISSPPPTKPVAGINGTQCSAYPACVAAGIKEGECCPTKANVPLGCCSGIMPPPAVKEEGGKNPFAKATASCSLYPKCMHLGLTGTTYKLHTSWFVYVPLTLSHYRNSSKTASQVLHGEYIQHVCKEAGDAAVSSHEVIPDYVPTTTPTIPPYEIPSSTSAISAVSTPAPVLPPKPAAASPVGKEGKTARAIAKEEVNLESLFAVGALTAFLRESRRQSTEQDYP